MRREASATRSPADLARAMLARKAGRQVGQTRALQDGWAQSQRREPLLHGPNPTGRPGAFTGFAALESGGVARGARAYLLLGASLFVKALRAGRAISGASNPARGGGGAESTVRDFFLSTAAGEGSWHCFWGERPGCTMNAAAARTGTSGKRSLRSGKELGKP
jgi:hypothetical protein